ncbi:MAG TPA: dienelactone hydrolase family protein [Stellaceae bacterium]|nr:dienelactone hydrolase family protein [Stellaceae bacterium]
MAGKEIAVAADGGSFDAYLAARAQGKGPGVVLVTHIYGVDRDTRAMCDDLAKHGSVALAQNFFWRDVDSGVLEQSAEGGRRARARAMRIDFAKAMGDLKCSIAELKRHPNCNGKIAVFGYCFGGAYVWRSACDGLGIDAGVSFHGTFVSKSMKPGDKPACPVSFHYGDRDELAPPEELAAVKKTADATGAEFVIHAGAPHGFMMPSNPHHYHAAAAAESWRRALQIIDTLRSETARA